MNGEKRRLSRCVRSQEKREEGKDLRRDVRDGKGGLSSPGSPSSRVGTWISVVRLGVHMLPPSFNFSTKMMLGLYLPTHIPSTPWPRSGTLQGESPLGDTAPQKVVGYQPSKPRT